MLAAVFRGKSVVRILRRELRVQGPAALLGGRVARMDQQRHESRHLRVLEQGFPQVSPSVGFLFGVVIDDFCTS